MQLPDCQLTKLLLFQDVEPESVRHLIDQCPLREFPQGEVLLSPGKDNQSAFVIIEGKASVHLGTIDSKSIAEVGRGESIGEMSALDKSVAPSAYVKAVQPITALEINNKILMQLINDSHAVARNFLFLLSNRLRSGNDTVTNSQQLQKEFEQHANVDSLTGLYNRRWINSYFDRLMRQVREKSECPEFAILIVDIDHFKKFNDRFGHLAGDSALRSTAHSLKENTRPTDIVTRYGGEEFLIILPNTSPEVAMLVAKRIVSKVKIQPITMGESNYPSITISAGIASLKLDDDFESLVHAADKSLYRAKQNGRDQAAMERV